MSSNSNNHASNSKYFIVNDTITPCNDDYDCPFTSICYYENDSKSEGWCGCDSTFGTVGNRCEQMSPMSIYRLVALIILLIMTSITLLLLIKENVFLFDQFPLVQRIKMWSYKIINNRNSDGDGNNVGIDGNNASKKTPVKKRRDWDVRVTTFLECFLCLIFLIIYHALTMVMLLNPTEQPLTVKYSTTKKRAHAYFRSVALTLFIFFFIAALLNVSILWLEVAVSSKKFKKVSTPQLSKRYRIAVLVFDICVAIVCSAINWYDITLTGIAAAVLFIIVLSLYAYSAFSITYIMRTSYRAMKKQMNGNKDSRGEAIKQSLLKIRRCALQVISWLGIWIICMLVLSVKFPRVQYDTIPNGQVIDFIVFVDIGFLCAIFAIWSLIMYLRKPPKEKSSTTGAQIQQNDDENESPAENEGNSFTTNNNTNMNTRMADITNQGSQLGVPTATAMLSIPSP